MSYNARARRAYDEDTPPASPSLDARNFQRYPPDDSFVHSRSPSPRRGTYQRHDYSSSATYSSRSRSRSRSLSPSPRRCRSRASTIGKPLILVSIVAFFAGVLHLLSKSEHERRYRERRKEQERKERQDRRRHRAKREQEENRDRWDEWRGRGERGMYIENDHGRKRMIEGPAAGSGKEEGQGTSAQGSRRSGRSSDRRR